METMENHVIHWFPHVSCNMLNVDWFEDLSLSFVLLACAALLSSPAKFKEIVQVAAASTNHLTGQVSKDLGKSIDFEP